MNTFNQRRTFLKQAGIVTIGFMGLSRCNQLGNNNAEKIVGEAGYGPLVPDPKGYLDLPERFTYKIISNVGDIMNDGLHTPAMPDGMGVFPLDENRCILVRNHENNPTNPANGAFGAEYENLQSFGLENLFDKGNGKMPGLGGTTTLVYNEKTGEVEKSYLSLAGTYRNCAGGVSPWGSWLTCEEDITPKGENIEEHHGYVFEVPASEDIKIAKPVPIKEMGRFYRESVCVDPETSIVYMTEDRGDGMYYRFIPNKKEKLHEGGKLQILAIKGVKGFDTRNWEGHTMNEGQDYDVEWIDIDPVETGEDDLRYRGFELGGALLARGEGSWFADGEVYIACTSGGAARLGQVFKYVPSPYEGTEKEKEVPGKLQIYIESKDSELMHMCDNMCIAPFGQMFLCEDNGVKNHVRGVTHDGRMFTMALNSGSTAEFAGVTFSPSGKTMFVNLQQNGHTLAITGPWAEAPAE